MWNTRHAAPRRFQTVTFGVVCRSVPRAEPQLSNRLQPRQTCRDTYICTESTSQAKYAGSIPVMGSPRPQISGDWRDIVCSTVRSSRSPNFRIR